PGRLEWIGLRTERRGHIEVVERAEALVDLGLAGDHRCLKIPGSARQVTLISSEYIHQIGYQLGLQHIDPSLLRRNLVISGMNMNLLRFQRLQIGEAIFETSALCHPCSRMNEALGKGAAAAMYGYGGLCAKIIQGGWISIDDKVSLCES
ncbi:MAG: MOSC domain-containing protein, partial [Moraxellaceae bacterium]